MIRTPSVLALLLFLFPTPGCDRISGKEFIEPDAMVEVVLATQGAVKEFPLRLKEPRHATVRVYFPPAELGHVSAKLKDAAGNELKLQGRPLLPSGLYHLVVSGKGASPEAFNVKVVTSPRRAVAKPVEDEKPNANASAEEAERLLFADTRVLRVDKLRPQHWFRFEANEAGFLLAMLKGKGGSSPQAAYHLQNAQGHGVDSRPINSDRGNALYARIEPGEYLLKIYQEPAGEIGATGTEMILTTRFRDKDYRTTGGVGVLTIGVAENSGTMNSLSFIADATGLPLIQTFTADDVQWVLAKAIGDELGPSPAWAMLGVFILILVLAAITRGVQRSGARVFSQLAELDSTDSSKEG